MQVGEGHHTCAMCGCNHLGTFMTVFCSNSCRWVYAIRQRLGLYVRKIA